MKYLIKSILLGLLIVVTSCDTKFDEVNDDPNNFTTAPDAEVLSAAQGFLGYTVDADLNGFSFLWAQYYTWGIGVSIGNQERFTSEPDDQNGYWQRSYANVLTDLNFLTKSEDLGYRGVAKVLKAYVYQGLVDHFGDVPYSEALRGEPVDGAIVTPKFDNASAIYDSLIVLVDEGLESIGTLTTSMGADDMIYGGDMTKWIKFANSLKLRLLMRTSETSPKGDQIKDLIRDGSFIESAEDIAAVPFVGGAGSQNPMYALFEWGVGDFYFASNASVNILNGKNDPRLGALYTPASTGTFTGQIRGIDQGTIDNEPFTAPDTDYSGSSPLVYGETMPAVLMSAWEVSFLRAEAAARYGTSDDDATLFGYAIQTSFDYYNLGDATDYATNQDYTGAASLDAKIDLIAIQKWISLNGTQEDEGWIETRRFDRPNSRLFTNGIFQNPPLSILPAGTYPASWLYPESERSLNPNAPAQRVITDKIFWDN